MNNAKHKISRTGLFHYFRLVFRSLLLVTGIVVYVVNKLNPDFTNRILNRTGLDSWFIPMVFCIFAFEMLTRFFPSSIESPGCQKQFARNYIKTGHTDTNFDDNNATALSLLLWITLNGIIGAFKLMGYLDDGIMLLLCIAYSVCDMICILFFCPFQTWLLKNKCCATCRIYNWDYAMMFTPLFFVKAWYSWSLLLMSLGLLFRWEITLVRHPERFSEKTNAYLSCANCTEKLCVHKKQLITLRKSLYERTKARIEKLTK